ncbi:endonuclease/exonuclease/phosphatase family protein [Nocardioides sp. W3-2-3]|nr:endonuclease/exonuclease/phosphatase family protein [Nocardioides convexus]
MTDRPLTVATWNIGGGITGPSHQRAATPSLDPYVAVLRANAPDLVFLREAHEHEDGRPGQTRELAERAGLAHWAAYPLSESHLLHGASLALGILSRYPLHNLAFHPVPAPALTATGPAGEQWTLHDKGYVVGRVALPGGDIGIATGHFFPLHRFGASAAEPRFRPLWQAFAADLRALAEAGPAVAGFDLNHSPVGDVLGEVLGPGRFTEAIVETPTTASGAQRDFLLHDHHTRLITASVVATASDHAYCQVRVQI